MTTTSIDLDLAEDKCEFAEEKKGSPSSQSVFGLRDHILKREELCRRKGDGGVGGGKLGASPRRPDLVLVDGAEWAVEFGG